MRLENIHRVYFIGIGGIGMSALARWFAAQGKRVAGYDRTATPLTKSLEAEGMDIHYEDNPALLKELVGGKDNTLAVLTAAIKGHQELEWLRSNGYTVAKRAEVLGWIANAYPNIAVAGTHGKTTTSSMIAHILKASGKSMTAFLGGIATNYDSNLIMHNEDGKSMWVVAEADEFDRSFLKLEPQIAVVTSADADHLDIYGNHEQMTSSFTAFIQKIRNKGVLIIHDSVKGLGNSVQHIKVLTYGMNRGQFFAGNVIAKGGFFEFDLVLDGNRIEKIRPGVPGFHNVENAVAAALAAIELGISEEQIKNSLASFKGVKRRFEFIIEREGLVYIDDYAHHPAEITAFLTSLRAMYPDKKLTVVFQPHLFTRTRDFAEGFAQSLSIADELLLMDIYPAREEAIPGISSEIIFEQVSTEKKYMCSKENVLQKIAELDIEVLATIGAGDIDQFVQPIKEILERKYAA